MKRYDHSRFNRKHQSQKWHLEHRSGGFRCVQCKVFVVINDYIGTANRNHCNICLHSRHVDIQKGDRKSACGAAMKPIGLTLKHGGYGKIGELMLIHLCLNCQKISINRLAADDYEPRVLEVFNDSLQLNKTLHARLQQQDIYPLAKDDLPLIQAQLFGK